METPLPLFRCALTSPALPSTIRTPQLACQNTTIHTDCFVRDQCLAISAGRENSDAVEPYAALTVFRGALPAIWNIRFQNAEFLPALPKNSETIERPQARKAVGGTKGEEQRPNGQPNVVGFGPQLVPLSASLSQIQNVDRDVAWLGSFYVD